MFPLEDHVCTCPYTHLTPKEASNSFFSGELEEDIRSHGMIAECVFKRDSDRECHMDKLVSIRKYTAYPHNDCSVTCKERGQIQLLTIMMCTVHRAWCRCWFHSRVRQTMGYQWDMVSHFPHCMYKCRVSNCKSSVHECVIHIHGNNIWHVPCIIHRMQWKEYWTCHFLTFVQMSQSQGRCSVKTTVAYYWRLTVHS